MTALFIVVLVVGVVETAAMLVISAVFRQIGRGEMGFRLIAQAAGFAAVGVAGLFMTWTNTGAPGFSIVSLVVLGLLLAFIYKVAIPYTHRRWPLASETHNGE
ncbi:hypothetical protein [Mycolicibacterium tusciae]|jgi:hypothetical protein|uniref:Uncharacterized protein n=1 Tax=Mycolicibacterium tusciae TaxID=75922 RepID=A0A1X0JVX4_9MYCO|nr:hypothetical protein [Mycolicibacterium tusciae]ORB66860.1 hypothetical protein BST47_07185 [Mycolicibacterium tusciae]